MRFLLDTCVISEFTKRLPHPNALRWKQSQADSTLFISSVTVGELRKGIERLPRGDVRRERIDVWFDALLGSFEGRVLPFDKDCAIAWGRIVGDSMRRGLSRSPIDIQIAATALKAGMTLATRNVRDMEGVGVSILNPFA